MTIILAIKIALAFIACVMTVVVLASARCVESCEWDGSTDADRYYWTKFALLTALAQCVIIFIAVCL